MNRIKDYICDYEVGVTNITVEKNLYSAEAIRAATYEITYRYSVLLVEEPVDKIKIILEDKDAIIDKEVKTRDIKNFLASLIDHQLRLDLLERFGFIRDKIVEKAFEPVAARIK